MLHWYLIEFRLKCSCWEAQNIQGIKQILWHLGSSRGGRLTLLLLQVLPRNSADKISKKKIDQRTVKYLKPVQTWYDANPMCWSSDVILVPTSGGHFGGFNKFLIRPPKFLDAVDKASKLGWTYDEESSCSFNCTRIASTSCQIVV